jgi:hypothetical protein
VHVRFRIERGFTFKASFTQPCRPCAIITLATGQMFTAEEQATAFFPAIDITAAHVAKATVDLL